MKSEYNLSYYVDEFAYAGTTLVPLGLIFSLQEIEKLIALQDQLPEEYVRLGDAGEPNDLYVKRVKIDLPQEQPKSVNGEVSEQILKILDSPNKKEKISKFISGDLFLRRCQINRMVKNSFIGLHLDTDSNPDYLASIVIQLGRSFSGGEFLTYEGKHVKEVYRPTFGSVLISACDIPHEVKTVLSQERTSLVYFYSNENGINQNV